MCHKLAEEVSYQPLTTNKTSTWKINYSPREYPETFLIEIIRISKMSQTKINRKNKIINYKTEII
jgi:hypothetical protein